MKKWFSMLVMCVAMIQGEALYLGNPSLPWAVPEGIFTEEEAAVGFKLGYQADMVWDRRLKSYKGAKARMDEFQIFSNQGVLACDLLDYFEVYGSVGTMQANFSHRPDPSLAQRRYQTSYKTTWGVGGRGVLFAKERNVIGIEGGYQYANLPLKWDALSGNSFTTGAHLHYQEWQVGIGVSRDMGCFIPYLAFKYSNVAGKVVPLRPNLGLASSSFKLSNRDHFGGVVGCTLTTGIGFDLTVESRFWDEQALSLALNLKF